MTKQNLQNKYPVFTKTILKEGLKYQNVDEILEALKQKIENHKIATLISIFDNFAHTKSIGGEISEGIIGAKNIIFCFGKAIPMSAILSVRPRSIGVVEYEKSFDISYLEAPSEDIGQFMENWIQEIAKDKKWKSYFQQIMTKV